MAVEMAGIIYTAHGRSHLSCPCGSYGNSRFLLTDAKGKAATPATWSGCTVGCPECSRVLSIDGVVLVGPADTDGEVA